MYNVNILIYDFLAVIYLVTSCIQVIEKFIKFDTYFPSLALTLSACMFEAGSMWDCVTACSEDRTDIIILCANSLRKLTALDIQLAFTMYLAYIQLLNVIPLLLILLVQFSLFYYRQHKDPHSNAKQMINTRLHTGHSKSVLLKSCSAHVKMVLRLQKTSCKPALVTLVPCKLR